MHRHFVTLGAAVAPGTLAIALATAAPVGAAELPRPVSPGSSAPGAVAAARCPTFSWAGVDDAPGYELALFRVERDGDADPILVTRKSLPAHAETWTPPQDQCLERGQHYAWSVAATRADAAEDASLAWSPPFLFEVGAGPSPDELEQAIDTIRRYRMQRAREKATSDDAPAAGDRSDEESMSPSLRRSGADRKTRRRPRTGRQLADELPGALTSPTTGANSLQSPGAPTLDENKVSFKLDVTLAENSNLFKDGEVFLWDDARFNTALGRNALVSSDERAFGNTAVGAGALERTMHGELYDYSPEDFKGSDNTAVGMSALSLNVYGSRNTAVGSQAISGITQSYSNTAVGYAILYRAYGAENTAIGSLALYDSGGSRNTASGVKSLHYNYGGGNTANGFEALYSNGGDFNTAVGSRALRTTSGSRNTGIGVNAGSAARGSDNIFLGSGATGTEDDTNTIRIGGVTGTGEGKQNRTFIAGIRGITPELDDAAPVVIDSQGQLGTASSSRAVKQDIREIGSIADRLLELRPVAFRYKKHAAVDPDTPLRYGLIAEEVAEVFPELVVYDDKGAPRTVKYQLLSALLVGEVQRLHARVESLEADRDRRHRGGSGRSPR